MENTTNNMLEFKPLKPFDIYTIDATTSTSQILKLTEIVKKTSKITAFSFYDTTYNLYYLQLELIREKNSILINVEFFHGFSFMLPELTEFISYAFNQSKVVHIWGDPDTFLENSAIYGIVHSNSRMNCNFVDVHKAFNAWYNYTSENNANPDQLLRFNNIHHASCTCSHGISPSLQAPCTLKRAIAYTFNESLDNGTFHLHKCQAITKLAFLFTKH